MWRFGVLFVVPAFLAWSQIADATRNPIAPPPSGCLALGPRPERRANIPAAEVEALAALFRATPVSEKKGWKEPRYLESLTDLYASTRDEHVLQLLEQRLRANLPAIGTSPHLVQSGMLLNPFAWYLHNTHGDPRLKAEIVATIGREIERWEPTWNGRTYVNVPERNGGRPLPLNQYGAFARVLILFAEATDDTRLRDRALLLKDSITAAFFATPCNGVAWHYAPERTKIDDVSHGALVADVLLAFHHFGYVDDRTMERIVANVINNAFVGKNLGYRLAGNREQAVRMGKMSSFQNRKCDRYMRFVRFSSVLLEKCLPHIGEDAYYYHLTNLVAFYPIASLDRRVASLTE